MARMAAPVTVIIPTLNEEEWIAASVESALKADASEVIVADGGSYDRTARFAKGAGARVMLTDRMRSRQLNQAVAAASTDELIFLHADSRLPPGAAAAVHEALSTGVEFGAFRLAFAERAAKLRIAETMINLRAAIMHWPWGDQAQFIRRDIFRQIGGFREIPIMEDYDLAERMRRRGHMRILPLTVVTSGRRFLRKGVLRTAVMNWTTIVRYRRGVDPEELAKSYRS